MVDARARRGDSPRRVLQRLGVDRSEVRPIVRGFRPARLRRMRVGDELRVGFDEGGEVRFVRYRRDVETAWCGERTERGRYRVRLERLPVDTELVLIEGVLFGSWGDALEAVDAPRGLGAAAAGLFPFAPDAGRPTSFRMVVEKQTVEGRTLGYGPLEALVVADAVRTRRVFRFPIDGRTDTYYHDDGRPVRRWRLPPPVLDAQLTSGFGRRRHPIRGRWRFHRGVDYGAARGAPVYAVAAGTVTAARYQRGLGRTVVIEHADGLVTRYAHLRRIASGLVSGDRVETGDLIGFVGSSGMSTGPHLHFETIHRGRHVDPLRYRPPDPPPLDDEGRTALQARIGRLLARLRDRVS